MTERGYESTKERKKRNARKNMNERRKAMLSIGPAASSVHIAPSGLCVQACSLQIGSKIDEALFYTCEKKYLESKDSGRLYSNLQWRNGKVKGLRFCNVHVPCVSGSS